MRFLKIKEDISISYSIFQWRLFSLIWQINACANARRDINLSKQSSKIIKINALHNNLLQANISMLNSLGFLLRSRRVSKGRWPC